MKYYASMCIGYCYGETEIVAGAATFRTGSWNENKQKCPDLRVKSDLSDKHWNELIKLINHQTLFALPDQVGKCLGCVDEVVEVIEVQFSDKSIKKIAQNMGDAPEEIKALAKKVRDVEQRLRKELPPVTVARCEAPV